MLLDWFEDFSKKPFLHPTWTIGDHWVYFWHHANTRKFVATFIQALAWSAGLMPLILVLKG